MKAPINFGPIAAIGAALTLLVSACGDYSNGILAEDLKYLNAVPSRAALELRVADPTPRQIEIGKENSELGSTTSALLGEKSNWLLFVSAFCKEVNAAIFGFINLVDIITQYPPAFRGAGEHIWGPWPSEDNPGADVRFRMTHDASSGLFGFSFDLQKSGQSAAPDQAWVSCIYGAAIPSAKGVRRSKGNLTIDLTSCDQINEYGEKGTAVIGFDTTPDDANPEGKTDLQIRFTNFYNKKMIEKGEDPLTADYIFKEQSDRSGEFDFTTFKDIDEGNAARTKLEKIELKVRWLNTGAGQVDGRISGGDLNPFSVTMIDCWNSEYKRVYYKDSYNIKPEEGQQQDCRFSPIIWN
jgi:hypothetical protein